MTSLFSERDPACLARRLTELERFDDRRERFLEHLDFAALDEQTCREISMADDHLAETLMFGRLYAQHLSDMIGLGEYLAAQPRQAA
jgi:hypothetical protein